MVDEDILRKLILRLDRQNAVVDFSRLRESGLTAAQIMVDSSLWRTKDMRDGCDIYKWLATDEIREDTGHNQKFFVQCEGYLIGMLGAVINSTEEQTVGRQMKKLDLVRKGLSATDQRAILADRSASSIQATPKGPGIYVYSFQVFLDNPDIISPVPRYRAKVGRGQNIQNRLKGQLTTMPQPLLPLRTYKFDATVLNAAEASLHSKLIANGFGNPDYKRKQTGNEWFSLELDFLDEEVKSELGYENETLQLWRP